MDTKDLSVLFQRLINNSEFQILVMEYRQRFGIPKSGFIDTSSTECLNWIKEAQRKTDTLRENFLFIAKRCANLIRGKGPIPLVVLAFYFLYNKLPDLTGQSNSNVAIFSISPSGILGHVDVIFTLPYTFTTKLFQQEVERHVKEIEQFSSDSKEYVTSILLPSSGSNSIAEKGDFLATTPGNGGDIVDRVHRDINYLVEFGRVVLREDLERKKEDDFVIREYSDKNKYLSHPVQQMGMWLLNRRLYPISEEYWRHIDEELQDYLRRTRRRVNRGIPLANMGVSQVAQGKVIEGLFNLFKAYEDDRECLAHLPVTQIDPERDLLIGDLYTQFEQVQIRGIFLSTMRTHQAFFETPISMQDIENFYRSLSPDKKLLLFLITYRYSFSFSLYRELTNPIARSEIIRSLAELALWLEDEFKVHDSNLRGSMLVNILGAKLGTNLNPVRGQFTDAASLADLHAKIQSAITTGGNLRLTNARVTACIRNFAGHNVDIQDHPFFQMSDEVFARIFSLILASRHAGWI